MWKQNPSTILPDLIKELERIKEQLETDIKSLKLLGGLNVGEKETKCTDQSK